MKSWVLPALLAMATVAGAEPRPTSCTICHAKPEIAALVGAGAETIVEHERKGVHAAVGLSCHDCHGGNPDPALAEDLGAMDDHFAPSPYVGKPERKDVPAFCGRCHSHPEIVTRFKPDARVDQEREYRTSRHGELLEQGDPNVATCIDCHGTHGILAAADPESPVYPQKVADTCSRCHSDAKRMAGYRSSDGRPLPVDQAALWRHSVHAAALFERGDLAAPTCNDCHGNHGAKPPGVDSVAFVCGQCHAREAELFRDSPKAAAFAAHREYMAAAGEAGCGSCHSPPSPAAKLGTSIAFVQCATCHGNHGIVRANLSMLGTMPPTPCDFCHESAGRGQLVEANARAQRHYEEIRSTLLEQAAAQHLEGAERFDWLVDRALELPTHTDEARGETGGLRPEFERLFTKFRIGKSAYVFGEGDRAVRIAPPRCPDCHASSEGGDPSGGLAVAEAMVDRMRRLTTATARAERLQLAARRGGVRLGSVLPHLDAAVTAQIELEVLVHAFSVALDGRFQARYGEGMQEAEQAVAGANDALDELHERWRGLVIFLGLLCFVLVAMVAKIREKSRED